MLSTSDLDTSDEISIRSEIMEYTLISYNWKEYVFHMRFSWNSQSILRGGLIPEGNENDKARQVVLFIPPYPFGKKNPNEEKTHDDYTDPQRVH